MVSERKFVMKGIWADKRASNLELEYQYFAPPNEIMYLGNDHHWLKTLQKKTSFHCVPPNEILTTTYKVFLIKKSNLDLIKSLDLNTSL